ncbi:MAG: acyl carrier protein [Thermomicrobiales bacterium]
MPEHADPSTQLQQIFQRVFSDDSIVIRPEMTADDVEAWDSLTHITLIMDVESHFGVRFRNAEVARLKNVGDLIRLVETHLAKKQG